jgi:hypothetical protein
MSTASIRRIHLLGFVEEVRHIHASMPDRRFCFVLGAGASKTSLIPTAGELGLEWLRKIHTECGGAAGDFATVSKVFRRRPVSPILPASPPLIRLSTTRNGAMIVLKGMPKSNATLKQQGPVTAIMLWRKYSLQMIRQRHHAITSLLLQISTTSLQKPLERSGKKSPL